MKLVSKYGEEEKELQYPQIYFCKSVVNKYECDCFICIVWSFDGWLINPAGDQEKSSVAYYFNKNHNFANIGHPKNVSKVNQTTWTNIITQSSPPSSSESVSESSLSPRAHVLSPTVPCDHTINAVSAPPIDTRWLSLQDHRTFVTWALWPRYFLNFAYFPWWRREQTLICYRKTLKCSLKVSNYAWRNVFRLGQFWIKLKDLNKHVQQWSHVLKHYTAMTMIFVFKLW